MFLIFDMTQLHINKPRIISFLPIISHEIFKFYFDKNFEIKIFNKIIYLLAIVLLNANVTKYFIKYIENQFLSCCITGLFLERHHSFHLVRIYEV